MLPAAGNKDCPNCGRRVGWVRRRLKAWIWARWTCPACGAVLGFSVARRLVGTLAIVFLIGLVRFLRWHVGIPEDCNILLLYAAIVVGCAVLGLLDSVVLRSSPVEPLKKLLPRE